MKWMKKLMAITLALIMMPVSALMVQAEPVDKAAVPELGILEVIGVLQESDLAKDANTKMSRAEFAEVIVKLADAEDVAQAFYENRYSYDVESTYYEGGFINAALALGAMAHTNGGDFDPLSAVSYAEAARAMVKILGYDSQMKAETEANFLTMANSLGILKNVDKNADGTINRGAIYQLIANSLAIDVLEPLALQGDMVLRYNGEENILSLYHDVYEHTAIIDATPFGAIDGGAATRRGMVRAGGEEYDCEKIDLSQLLGYRTKLYYTQMGYEREIIFASSYRNEILTVPAEDITGYANRTYTFFDEDGKQETESTYGAKILYNGSSAEGASFNSIPEQGEVCFIDNDRDGSYEVVSIFDYIDYIVAGVDIEAQKIYVKDAEALDFENAEVINVVNSQTGAKQGLEALVNGEAITVLANANNTIATIYRGAASLSGQVESRFTEGSKDIAVIGGTEYVFSKLLQDAIAAGRAADITVGGDYKFNFNHFGKLISAESNGNYLTDYTYGIAVAGKTGNGLDDTVTLKIMSALGIYEELTVKENCYVDDVRIAKPTQVLKMFNHDGELKPGEQYGDTFVPQPLRFKVNSDGKITHIDLVGEKNMAKEGLYLVDAKYADKDGQGKNDYYQYNSAFRALAHFGSGNRPNFPVGSTTVYLKAPIDVNNDVLLPNFDLYGAAEVNNLGKNMRLYKHDANSLEIEMLLVGTQTDASGAEVVKISSTTSVNIFLDSVQAVDAEGNAVTRIRFSSSGTVESLDVADTVDLTKVSTTADAGTCALEPGDVFRYRTNDKGLIGKIEVLWKYAPNEETGNPGHFVGNSNDDNTFKPVAEDAYTIKISYQDGTALDMFYVYKRQDTFIRLTGIRPDEWEEKTGDDSLKAAYMLYTPRNSVLANAIMYDGEKNEVSKVNANEIREYASVGNDCTRGLLWRDDGDPRKLIFFK